MAINKKLKDTIWNDFLIWIKDRSGYKLTADMVDQSAIRIKADHNMWKRIEMVVPTMSAWNHFRNDQTPAYHWLMGYLEGWTEVVAIDVDHQAVPGIH